MIAVFIRNLDAFTQALGIENAPAIVHFSLLPWESDQQRDDFIKDITGINLAQVSAYGA